MNLYTCTKCGQALQREEFGTNIKGGKPYRRAECKRCLYARARLNLSLRRFQTHGWSRELRALEAAS